MQKFESKIPWAKTGPGTTLCASLLVRACAVEMRLDISQEPCYAKNFKKNAGAQSEHPDQAPAFTLTVRTCQGGRTVWGKTNKSL